MYLRMRYSVIRNIPPQVLVEIATFLSLQDRLLSKNLFICKTWSETLSGSYARQTLSRPEYRGLIFHRKEPLPWYQLSGELLVYDNCLIVPEDLETPSATSCRLFRQEGTQTLITARYYLESRTRILCHNGNYAVLQDTHGEIAVHNDQSDGKRRPLFFSTLRPHRRQITMNDSHVFYLNDRLEMEIYDIRHQTYVSLSCDFIPSSYRLIDVQASKSHVWIFAFYDSPGIQIFAVKRQDGETMVLDKVFRHSNLDLGLNPMTAEALSCTVSSSRLAIFDILRSHVIAFDAGTGTLILKHHEASRLTSAALWCNEIVLLRSIALGKKDAEIYRIS